MGCKLAAFLAGYQPNRIPVAVETPIAKATAPAEIAKGILISLLKSREISAPTIIPIMPPTKVRIADSIKN